MRRKSLIPLVTLFGLFTAPTLPNQSKTLEIEVVKPPHQVMAAPVMPKQAVQTASIASERVEPTPMPQSPTKRFSGDARAMLRTATANRFGYGQVDAMLNLMGKESGLNPYAINKSSGACGIPQAYPCSKLLNVIGSLDNVTGQIDWLLNYVANRYGTPSQALTFHRANGWY